MKFMKKGEDDGTIGVMSDISLYRPGEIHVTRKIAAVARNNLKWKDR